MGHACFAPLWALGASAELAALEELEEAGVQVERYRPLRWYNISRLNNRTHRKLLVVDGTVGFTGGVGIADTWAGRAQDPEHWRDMHFRIEGPVVAQLQAAFNDNWVKATGVVKPMIGAALLRSIETPSAEIAGVEA